MNKLKILILFICLSSCEIENIEYRTPIIATNPPESILSNSVILGGDAIGEGGKEITEFGIVYSTSVPPMITDIKFKEGERIGAFSKRYDGLENNTTYYYSAYAINEIGVAYGAIYEFKTDEAATCAPAQEDFVKWSNGSIAINKVSLEKGIGIFDDGNLEFIAEGYSSTTRIFLNFLETDMNLPLSGSYTTVREFDRQSTYSNGEVIVIIQDFGLFSGGGGTAEPGLKMYIENNNGNLTFIFCDFKLSDYYDLTGKFDYPQ